MRTILLSALAFTLATPDFADAQLFGRNRGYGYGYGGNPGYGYGYGGNPGYGYGGNPGYGGYGGAGFGIGYTDGNFGIGYQSGSPYYGGYGRGNYGGGGYPNYGGGYAYSQPGYGGTSYGNQGYMGGGTYMGSPDMSGGNIYQAGYAGMNMSNVVRLDIIVPDDNIELTIQNQRVGGMGRHRMFVSPQLEQGKEYTYTISVKGSQVRGGEDTRKIDVKPGGQFTVDFTRPQGERLPAPAGGIETDRPRSDTIRDRDVNPPKDNPVPR